MIAEEPHKAKLGEILELNQLIEDARNDITRQKKHNAFGTVVFLGASQIGKTLTAVLLAGLELSFSAGARGLTIQNADPNHPAVIGTGSASETTKPIFLEGSHACLKFIIVDTPGFHDSGSPKDSIRNYCYNYGILTQLNKFVFILTIEKVGLDQNKRLEANVRKFLNVFKFDQGFKAEDLARSSLLLITKDRQSLENKINQKITQCHAKTQDSEVKAFLGVILENFKNKVVVVKLIASAGKIEIDELKGKVVQALKDKPIGTELREPGRIRIVLSHNEANAKKENEAGIEDVIMFNYESVVGITKLVMQLLQAVQLEPDHRAKPELIQKIAEFVDSKTNIRRPNRFSPKTGLLEPSPNRISQSWIGFLIENNETLKNTTRSFNRLDTVLYESLEKMVGLYVKLVDTTPEERVILNSLAWFINELQYEKNLYGKIKLQGRQIDIDQNIIANCIADISEVYERYSLNTQTQQSAEVKYYLNCCKNSVRESAEFYEYLDKAIACAREKYEGSWNKEAIETVAQACEDVSLLHWAIYFNDILGNVSKIENFYKKILEHTSEQNRSSVLLKIAHFELHYGFFESARRNCMRALSEATTSQDKAQARQKWLSITKQKEAEVMQTLTDRLLNNVELNNPICGPGLSELSSMAQVYKATPLVPPMPPLPAMPAMPSFSMPSNDDTELTQNQGTQISIIDTPSQQNQEEQEEITNALQPCDTSAIKFDFS